MNKILFLDTLTTGLSLERCSIYRIGGVLCKETPFGLEEIKRFDICSRPAPGARIIDNSLWVGGMTRAKLAYLPEQEKAFSDFMKIIEENINLKNPKDKIYLSGFNTSAFDMPFLRNFYNDNKSEDFRNCFYMQAIDLMNLAAFVLINEREGMSDFHLETTAKMLGISPVRNAKYSPLDNVETCIKMYLELKKRYFHCGELKYTKTTELFKNHNF